jgi:lipoprotein-releasing system ATP-binding protein
MDAFNYFYTSQVLFKPLHLNMLKATGIFKNYGTLPVLKGVDIEITKGEIVSIAGSSGAGKSTLLHILGTLDKADGGYIEINGVRIESVPERKLEPVIWWKRVVNYLLDWFFIGLITSFLAKSIGDKITFDNLFDWTHLFYSSLVVYLYYTLFEGFTGRTLGKFITQTKIAIRSDGTKVPFTRCLLRSLGRFIPWEFLTFFSKKPLGLHDTISNTIVIDDQIPYEPRIKNRLSGYQLAAFRNKHIGFVFQFHHLLPEFTALENVCIPGWIAGRKTKEVQEKALSLLELLGLKDRAEHKPGELSGGEQQRVAVARALINNPSIVMADEPTGNLDSANAKELHNLFIDLRNRLQQTFLIVTHNEELAQMSDRILHMKDGRII